MLTVFLHAALLIFIAVTLLWVLSVVLTNAGIVDVFWGFGYVMVNAVYFFYVGEWQARNFVLLALVTIWGLRLSLYIGLRNYGKGEDFRYRAFRQNYGPKRYWWFSYFQVFLLQGGLVLLVSLPLLGAHYGKNNGTITLIDYLALVVWGIGFVFEAGADYQLARFKNNPGNKGKVLDTGLWKYTRHPNYFGDAAVWWGFALLSVAAGNYWPVAGSLLMTWLLLKVSGVSLLERTLKESKPHYRSYMEKTNAFFPWFPKK